MIELCDCVIVIQRTPDHWRWNCKESARRELISADRARGRDGAAAHRCPNGVTNVTGFGVVGFVDAAVVTGKHRLVGGAVVIWMKLDDVVVSVNELRIAVIWWSAIALEPPVRCDGPVSAAVVGAKQVNTTGPDFVLVSRIDGDHVVVPTLI